MAKAVPESISVTSMLSHHTQVTGAVITGTTQPAKTRSAFPLAVGSFGKKLIDKEAHSPASNPPDNVCT